MAHPNHGIYTMFWRECLGCLSVNGSLSDFQNSPEMAICTVKMFKFCILSICYIPPGNMWPSMGKPSHFSDVNVHVLYLYISRAEYSVQRASQYLKYFVSYYILKCWSWKTWKKVIFTFVWIKELYWNTIHFNDIRCNFKALLNIFLHFGMDNIYQRGIFTKKTFPLFPFFSEFCLCSDFGRVFP
jgi:hypothetical protein